MLALSRFSKYMKENRIPPVFSDVQNSQSRQNSPKYELVTVFDPKVSV